MALIDLTINQLKRAAAVKEQIEALSKELGSIFGVSANSGISPRKKRAVRAAAKNDKAAKPAARSINPATKRKKKVFSSATRAKLSAKLKAYWAAKRAGKK